MARTMSASVSYVVSTRTDVPGNRGDRHVAPAPSRTGIRRSMSTTSGAAAAQGEGLRAVGGLADDLDVGSREQRHQTRADHGMVVDDQHPDHRGITRRNGAAARLAEHVHRPADLDPRAHPSSPKPPRCHPGRNRPVVDHFERDRVVGRERELHPSGRRMTAHVGQRLLRDAQETTTAAAVRGRARRPTRTRPTRSRR